MSTIVLERTIRLPRLHPAQQQIIHEARRFNVACCGRRFGKTLLGIDRLVDAALQGSPVAWFSPTYRMLSEVWRDLRHRLAPVASQISVQEHRLELLTGGVIEMWSLDNPDVARGRKYRRVVIDEAAIVRDLEGAWQAVIRPALTDYAGDAWFLSTPHGRNYFAHLYALGQDADEPDWVSWRMPTSANPYISAAEIEAARRQLVERVFLQEYMAEIIDDAGSVFRGVMDAARAQPEQGPVAGHTYVAGVDWGKHEDWTVICVLDVTARRQVYQDRFNRVDYTQQAGRLQALAERFGLAAIVAERNSMGEPVIEQLVRQGLPVVPFTTTAASKALLIDALALALERRELEVLNDPVLVGELLAFRAERLPGGTLRYSAPHGAHDDCVMALALAWWGARDGGGAPVVHVFRHGREEGRQLLPWERD